MPNPVRRVSLPVWQRTAAEARHAEPAVIESGVAPASSPELLARMFADVDVSVRRRRDGRVWIDRATLGDFVARMRADDVHFAPAIPLERLPGLLDELALAPLLPTVDDWSAARDHARLHVGDSMRMRLHWEPVDLLLAQVHGSTSVVAEPPDSAAALYPSAAWPTASRVDLDDPRHDTDFPLHTGEGRLAAVLTAGDVLHVPRGWWYSARAGGRAVWATVGHGPVLPLTDEVHDRLVVLAERAS